MKIIIASPSCCEECMSYRICSQGMSSFPPLVLVPTSLIKMLIIELLSVHCVLGTRRTVALKPPKKYVSAYGAPRTPEAY